MREHGLEPELLVPGVLAWVGEWPIARWFSIDTVRQERAARTFIRRALRQARA